MQFFAGQVRVPASTPFARDPRALPRWTAAYARMFCGLDHDGSTAFWDAVDKIGDYQTANPNGVARTIVNVSGNGVLYGLIGPQLDTAGAVTTWTVTVDGTAYTIAHASGSTATTRSIIGRIFETRDRFITTAQEGGHKLSTDIAARPANDTHVAFGLNVNLELVSPHLIDKFIKFDTSLIVTVQTAQNPASGTLPNYAGAIWGLTT